MTQKTFAALILFFLSLLIPCSGHAFDTTSRLALSVQRLNTWLGSDVYADAWRRELKLSVLESQVAQGYRANPVALGEVLDQFEANNVAHPAFDEVRDSIRDQIEMLERSNIGDLNAAIQNAKNEFHQTSIDELVAVQSLAVHDAEALLKFYESKLSTVDRNEAFATLNVRQLIDDLRKVTFELPPADSAGKLGTQISALQKALNLIVEKLDALPIDADPTKPSEERKKLQAQLETQQKEIDALKKQRSTIAAADKPRKQQRGLFLRNLSQYRPAFEEVTTVHQDAYMFSSLDSFSRFFRLYAAATDDNLENRVNAQLDNLANELANLNGDKARLAAARIGALIGFLENSGQSQSLVAAIRRKYSLPNFHIAISEKVINEIASRPVTDSTGVAETILGRCILGQAYTTGQVTIDVVDNPDMAHISIHMLGQMNSDTYTKQGPITAFAGANAQVEARRSVYGGLGGMAASPPYGAANLQSQFRGVQPSFRIIQRIAEKQYCKDKLLSEAISAGRLEQKMITQFRTQTDEQLAKGKEKLSGFKKDALARAGLLPRIQLHSGGHQLHAHGIRSTTSTLAATNAPQPGSVQPEIGVQIHETLASNYIDPLFAGKTFTNKQLGEKTEELLGSSPKAFEGEDWQITFAPARPIQFEFENNRFKVVINGRRFAQEGNEIRAALEIRLQFKFERVGDKIRFVRDGDAVITFVDLNQKDAKTVGFVGFLTKKLNEEPEGGDTLADTELADNLIPMDQLPELADSPIAQKLRLVECRTENGWFYLGWDHQLNDKESTPVDLPAIVNTNLPGDPIVYIPTTDSGS